MRPTVRIDSSESDPIMLRPVGYGILTSMTPLVRKYPRIGGPAIQSQSGYDATNDSKVHNRAFLKVNNG